MAKNKNRDRNQQKDAQAAERGRQNAEKSAMEAHSQSAATTPGDMARKSREKRFGHN
ncbi:hypothetical protein AB0I10_06705 [Streptomyces sp. NPDC050636]|uniref:hypothetical protein n=1 Tax=Streptomyces sp. NPDC050636 TaxID=3154510 RepID=UPI00344A4E2B